MGTAQLSEQKRCPLRRTQLTSKQTSLVTLTTIRYWPDWAGSAGTPRIAALIGRVCDKEKAQKARVPVARHRRRGLGNGYLDWRDDGALTDNVECDGSRRIDQIIGSCGSGLSQPPHSRRAQRAACQAPRRASPPAKIAEWVLCTNRLSTFGSGIEVVFDLIGSLTSRSTLMRGTARVASNSQLDFTMERCSAVSSSKELEQPTATLA